MMPRRLGMTPMRSLAGLALLVFCAGDVSTSRKSSGEYTLLVLCLLHDWSSTAAPATIGDAPDVPLKPVVYAVVEALEPPVVSMFSPQPKQSTRLPKLEKPRRV